MAGSFDPLSYCSAGSLLYSKSTLAPRSFLTASRICPTQAKGQLEWATRRLIVTTGVRVSGAEAPLFHGAAGVLRVVLTRVALRRISGSGSGSGGAGIWGGFPGGELLLRGYR